MNMQAQILAVVMYVTIAVNLFAGAFISATPAEHPLPWWVLASYAGFNALSSALKSDGLSLPTRTVAKVAAWFAVLVIGVSVLGACTSTGGVAVPTTAREALAAAEISYTQAAVSANTLVGTVSLTAAQKTEVSKADADAGNALNILDDAVMALPANASTTSVQAQLQAVQTLVAALTAIVAKDGGK